MTVLLHLTLLMSAGECWGQSWRQVRGHHTCPDTDRNATTSWL